VYLANSGLEVRPCRNAILLNLSNNHSTMLIYLIIINDNCVVSLVFLWSGGSLLAEANHSRLGRKWGRILRETEMQSEGQNNFEFVENHVNNRNHAPSLQRCVLGRYSQPQPLAAGSSLWRYVSRIHFCQL
jgi:hypothetical protein